jgi:hypothetical protein
MRFKRSCTCLAKKLCSKIPRRSSLCLHGKRQESHKQKDKQGGMQQTNAQITSRINFEEISLFEAVKQVSAEKLHAIKFA